MTTWVEKIQFLQILLMILYSFQVRITWINLLKIQLNVFLVNKSFWDRLMFPKTINHQRALKKRLLSSIWETYIRLHLLSTKDIKDLLFFKKIRITFSLKCHLGQKRCNFTKKSKESKEMKNCKIKVLPKQNFKKVLIK